jgi:hypothetical protein
VPFPRTVGDARQFQHRPRAGDIRGRRYRSLYARVCWCPAETRIGLLTSLTGLAVSLGVVAAEEPDLRRRRLLHCAVSGSSAQHGYWSTIMSAARMRLLICCLPVGDGFLSHRASQTGVILLIRYHSTCCPSGKLALSFAAVQCVKTRRVHSHSPRPSAVCRSPSITLLHTATELRCLSRNIRSRLAACSPMCRGVCGITGALPRLLI